MKPEKPAEKKTPGEDFKLILSDSICDIDIVEKDTSASKETIQNIREFVTNILILSQEFLILLSSKLSRKLQESNLQESNIQWRKL